MTEGICLFAYNNSQIDYTRIAMLASVCAKKHLNKPVALITNDSSWAWLRSTQSFGDIKLAFDDVIISDDELDSTNTRLHYNSPWNEFSAPFYNTNKHKIFEYTPYDKTLLMDIDYICKTDFLNHAFSSYEGVAMYDRAKGLQNNNSALEETFLYDAGIPMWWSTIIYFDQSQISKAFFDLWSHIAENYSYYRLLYNFPGKLFRTDYCVSIAVHILNGMQPGDVINTFADQPLLNMYQKDVILEVNKDNWLMLANNVEQNWQNLAVNHKNLDLHCMNKRSLDDHWKKIWEYNT